MTYNISSVENATNYAEFFSGVNDLTGGLYINTFLVLIWLIVFISLDGEAPVKSIVASFVTFLISTGLFFSNVGSENAIIVTSSLLFLSLLWQLNR